MDKRTAFTLSNTICLHILESYISGVLDDGIPKIRAIKYLREYAKECGFRIGLYLAKTIVDYIMLHTHEVMVDNACLNIRVSLPDGVFLVELNQYPNL